MLTFVRSVTVRFAPLNPNNGTARQYVALFLAQCKSPSHFQKYSNVEVKAELFEDAARDPEIEIVYEDGAQTVINAKGLKMRDLHDTLGAQLQQLEWEAIDKQPENDEENPYLALAKQQEEKLEAKRKKMLAMEKRT